MTEYTGGVYTENDIELSWLIESGANYEKNQITQQRDRSYGCNLWCKQNLATVSDQTRCGLWQKLDKIMA